MSRTGTCLCGEIRYRVDGEIGPPGNQVGGRADLVFRFKNGKTVRSAREYDTSDRVAGGTRYHD